MTERQEIENAMAALEAQRDSLGNAAIEAALSGLRQRLAEYDQEPGEAVDAKPMGPWSDERKPVTILFVDFSGFTDLSEKTDPEIVRQLINACFSSLVPIVLKYEGTVEKFIGDEIMAMFGAPVVHENDAERAVLVALEMMAKLQEFNRLRNTDLGIHIGINTGPVVAGGIGSTHQQQYGVTGDAVNLAARLTDIAQHGQILVGHPTWKLTSARFEYKPLPPILLKGKAEAVPVYQLLGPKEKPGRARGLERHGIASPLVGREAEYERLSERVAKCMDGQGSLAIIFGEAGLGKSRLISEIRRLLPQPNRLLWLESSILAYGHTLSYWPFQEILRNYAGLGEDEGEDQALMKLEQKISTLFQENTEEIFPYLASLLNLEVLGRYRERVRYLDGEAMGKQIFLATHRFFERLAAAQPVVLVFDDLHWIDESSQNLLDHILPLISQAPLMIVGLSRPGQETPATRLLNMASRIDPSLCTEIHLSPLTSQESQQLLHNLLNLGDLANLAGAAISRAEGNPFFLEELIRTLIDNGVIVRHTSTGSWLFTDRAGAFPIPDTIQGLILARLDRLDEDVKQVLRLASVIGRSFLVRLLHRISEDVQGVDARLAELEKIEMIAEKQRVPELEYMFRHALAQEVTYESMLLQKRKEIHAQVAQAIETLFSDRLEEFYSLVSYHYAKAEAWEKALDYLVKAGNQAGRIAGDAEALEYYRQAMAAYGRMVGDRWDSFQRATLEHRIGEAHYRRGENVEAIKYFKSALGHLGFPVSESRSEIRRAILFGLGKQAARRLASVGAKMHIAEDSPPVIEEVNRLCLAIAWITVVSDQEYFLYIVLKALDLAEKYHHPLMATGFSSLGTVFDFLSMSRVAAGYHQLALKVAQRAKQPDLLGVAYFSLTLHEALVGKFNQALDYGRQARQVYWDTGDLRGWGLISETVGQLLVYQGKYPQALEVGLRLLDLGTEVGDPELECWGALVLGTARYALGMLEAAHDHLSQSTQLARQIPDFYSLIFGGGQLGQCLLDRGEIEPALAILEESRQISRQHNIRGNAVTPHYHGLMKAYLLLAGRTERALKVKWLAKASGASRDVRKQARSFRGGLPEALLLNGHLARLKGNPAKTRRLWQRSLQEAEQMGMQSMLALAHREIGQYFGEQEHLARAEAIFLELGVVEKPARIIR